MAKSKGAYEAEISKAITQWEKDFLGRGSLSVKTDILRDMIIVNLQRHINSENIEYARHKKAYLTLNERGRNLWSQDKMI